MINKRGEFDLIKAKYDKVGKEGARVSQSTLIIIQPISATSSLYKFPVTINDGALVVPEEEIRLDITDEFIVQNMGFFLRAVLIDSVLPNSQASVYLTCAPFELAGESITFEKLYAGRLQIMVNNIVYLSHWDLRKHEYRGITQTKNFSAGIPNATWYANNFAENGMQEVLPSITLSGAKKSNIEVTLPSAITGAPASIPFISADGQTINVVIKEIVFMARGYLAQNASTFQ